MKIKNLRTIDYLAGICVSEGIVYTLLIIIFFIDQNIGSISNEYVFFINILSYGSGSFVAGFFTARKSSQEQLKVGFTIGLISILTHTIIDSVLSGAIYTNFWIWTIYLFGGLMGGMVAYRFPRARAV